MSKIAVVGSRNFNNKDFVVKTLKKLIHNKNNLTDSIVLVSGGASGVDSWAEDFWKLHKLNCIIFKAEWDKYGKSAGFLRNKQIIDEADFVIVFWDGISKGTKHSIDLAIKRKLPINIYIR